MAGRDIVEGLSKAAAAAKHPKEAAEQALDAAKGVVSKGAAAAEKLLHREHHADVEVTQPAGSEAQFQQATEQALTGEERPGAEPADEATDATAEATDAPEATAEEVPEPQIVLAEPAPPAEPPIDIVEQVLAAEAEQPVYGHATEPKASTRDEEHGEAGLQRAEADEIAEEVAESFPGGDLDVATPVGTTGADVGFNPDTAEADLQQPGTEPLVDPALTKAVKAEQDTLRRASAGGREPDAREESTDGE